MKLHFIKSFRRRQTSCSYLSCNEPHRFRFTRATYGFKNIASLTQEAGNTVIRDFERACAFIEDFMLNFEISSYQIGILFKPDKTYFQCIFISRPRLPAEFERFNVLSLEI